MIPRQNDEEFKKDLKDPVAKVIESETFSDLFSGLRKLQKEKVSITSFYQHPQFFSALFENPKAMLEIIKASIESGEKIILNNNFTRFLWGRVYRHVGCSDPDSFFECIKCLPDEERKKFEEGVMMYLTDSFIQKDSSYALSSFIEMYHQEKTDMSEFFSKCLIADSAEVFRKLIQIKEISIDESIIAATCAVANRCLETTIAQANKMKSKLNEQLIGQLTEEAIRHGRIETALILCQQDINKVKFYLAKILEDKITDPKYYSGNHLKAFFWKLLRFSPIDLTDKVMSGVISSLGSDKVKAAYVETAHDLLVQVSEYISADIKMQVPAEIKEMIGYHSSSDKNSDTYIAKFNGMIAAIKSSNILPADLVDKMDGTMNNCVSSLDEISSVYSDTHKEFNDIAPFFARYSRTEELLDMSSYLKRAGNSEIYTTNDKEQNETNAESYAVNLSNQINITNISIYQTDLVANKDYIYAMICKEEIENLLKEFRNGELISPQQDEFKKALTSSKDGQYPAAALLEKISSFRAQNNSQNTRQKSSFEKLRLSTVPMQTFVLGRYQWAQHLIRNMYFSSSRNKIEDSQGTVYSSYDNQGNEMLKIGVMPMPSIHLMLGEKPNFQRQHLYWQHGSQKLDPVTWKKYVEDPFSKIINMKFTDTSSNSKSDLQNHESQLNEFYALAAELVWGIGQLTPLERGTGTFAEWMFTFVHRYHGLQTPVLDLNFPQLDVLDITFSLSDYKKIFPYFFDPASLPKHLHPSDLSSKTIDEKMQLLLLQRDKTNEISATNNTAVNIEEAKGNNEYKSSGNSSSFFSLKKKNIQPTQDAAFSALSKLISSMGSSSSSREAWLVGLDAFCEKYPRLENARDKFDEIQLAKKLLSPTIQSKENTDAINHLLDRMIEQDCGNNLKYR